MVIGERSCFADAHFTPARVCISRLTQACPTHKIAKYLSSPQNSFPSLRLLPGQTLHWLSDASSSVPGAFSGIGMGPEFIRRHVLTGRALPDADWRASGSSATMGEHTCIPIKRMVQMQKREVQHSASARGSALDPHKYL